MSSAIDALAVPALRKLVAYDPGHDLPALRQRFAATGLVELGSNESPFGPGPAARAAIQQALDEVSLYPDPEARALRAAIAQQHGVQPEQVTVGNGSHELLMLLAQCFLGSDDELLCSRYGFAVFPIAARACGAGLHLAEALPADAVMSRGHDLAAFRAGLNPRTRLVCIANPNNPTGTWLDSAALREFIDSVPEHALVLVDEAYFEYLAPGSPSAADWMHECPRLVVTRTFSKAHGLAGLRLGYALSSPAVAAVLARLRESFNSNGIAQAAGLAALGDGAHLDQVREATVAERHWLAEQLTARGLKPGPSAGNFLLVDFGRDATAIEQGLLAQGVVVRPMTGYGLADCLRITIAKREHHLRLLDALDCLLERST